MLEALVILATLLPAADAEPVNYYGMSLKVKKEDTRPICRHERVCWDYADGTRICGTKVDTRNCREG